MLYATKTYLTDNETAVRTDYIRPVTIRLDKVVGYYENNITHNGQERMCTAVALEGGLELTLTDQYTHFDQAYTAWANGLTKFRKN